jgi:hypothetical protein
MCPQVLALHGHHSKSAIGPATAGELEAAKIGGSGRGLGGWFSPPAFGARVRKPSIITSTGQPLPCTLRPLTPEDAPGTAAAATFGSSTEPAMAGKSGCCTLPGRDIEALASILKRWLKLGSCTSVSMSSASRDESCCWAAASVGHACSQKQEQPSSILATNLVTAALGQAR